MKIFSFPFALTLESSLTIADMELLQKHDPRSLALRDITPTGEEYETFRIGYSPVEYGSVNANSVTFVGETESGKAGMSFLIPSNLQGEKKDAYIDNKLAAVSRNVSIVEANAAKAVIDVKAAQKSFLKSIVALKMPNKRTVESAPAAEAAIVDGGNA